MSKKIAVIGGGNIGGALIDGFLKSGELTPSDIVVGTPGEPEQKHFREMGLAVYTDNREAVKNADLVIISVKPWIVSLVAEDIRTCLKPDTLIVSASAGVPLEVLQGYFGKKSHCFRIMPNMAASLGTSMTFVSCGKDEEKFAPAILDLFKLAGEVALIPEELLDSAMVTASCGLAYAMRYIRASMEASIQMGLSAKLSLTVLAQTVKGAAELLLSGGEHPEVLIDQVTTQGGVTIVGLNAMEHSGFTSAVIKGHLSAYQHVKKVGQE